MMLQAWARRWNVTLAKVRNAGKHLLGLISNVLDLSKVEAGKMELDLQETGIDTLSVWPGRAGFATVAE